MVSRRIILISTTAILAGCTSSEANDFTPDNHVPDDWHDSPEKGNAEQVERSVNADGNYKRTCEETAVETVTEYVYDYLDDNTNIAPITCCQEIEGEASLIVYRRIDLDRDRNVVSSPNAEFDEVREATPAAVTINLLSNGSEEFVCSYPVYVKDSVEQMD